MLVEEKAYNGGVRYAVQMYTREIMACDKKTWVECRNGQGEFGSDCYQSYPLNKSGGHFFISKTVPEKAVPQLDTSREYTLCGGIHEQELISIHEKRSNGRNMVPTERYREIREDISLFLRNKDFYTAHNMVYKRGYLLYGRPGDGKTSIIQQLVDNLFLGKAFVMHLHVLPNNDILKALSDYDDVLKVFIIEDLQAFLGDHTKRLLNLLDGRASIPNCIFLATTNYPKEIPGNIIDRPSRFDCILHVSDPTKAEIRSLVESWTGDMVTDDTVDALHGFSIAAIKEVILLHKMHSISIPEAIAMLRTRAGISSTSFQKADVRDAIL